MLKPIINKVCTRCGVSFTTEWPKTKYCSDPCRFGVARCAECDKEFVLRANAGTRFCSKGCWYAHYAKRGKYPKQCPICGVAFHGEAATCSRTCGKAYQRRKNPNRRTTCEECGKALPSTVVPGRRFCSGSCASRVRNRAVNHTQPEGTRRPQPSGYVLIKVGQLWQMEHRAVMEQVLGRSLARDEVVHHKDGVRSNNHPDNLELWTVLRKDPAGQRTVDLAIALLQRLGPEERAFVLAQFKE